MAVLVLTGEKAGGRGVIVVSFSPPTRSRGDRSTFGAWMLLQFMALPRYGTVAEIAAMIAYLAGPKAGYVTGASLTIDGGFTA